MSDRKNTVNKLKTGYLYMMSWCVTWRRLRSSYQLLRACVTRLTDPIHTLSGSTAIGRVQHYTLVKYVTKKAFLEIYYVFVFSLTVDALTRCRRQFFLVMRVNIFRKGPACLRNQQTHSLKNYWIIWNSQRFSKAIAASVVIYAPIIGSVRVLGTGVRFVYLVLKQNPGVVLRSRNASFKGDVLLANEKLFQRRRL